MQNKDLIIIALIVAIIYLYYQNKKQKSLFYSPNNAEQAQKVSELQSNLLTFDKGNETIANLKVENEDLISDKDQAIRDKKTAEQELLSVSNKLKLKNQEVTNKDKEITRLKDEKSKVEISLNKELTELKTKYSKQGKLLDEEQTDNNKLVKEQEKLQEKIKELEQERSNLLDQVNKNDDLDDFSTWLNENEERKANLPDWDKVIREIKDKISDYHLKESNWASGLLTRNTKYWQVFKNWIDNSH